MPTTTRMLPSLATTLLALAPAFANEGAPTRPARAPNVLILMTDQHNHEVLGCAGNAVARTPNLDRLASEGARVTGALCATPFCSPTRASLWTGQWPHTHGITLNVPKPAKKPARDSGGRRDLPGLTDDETVLFNLLFDRGYRVGYFGKWNAGEMSDLRCFRGVEDERDLQTAYHRWLARQGPGILDRVPRPGEVFVEADRPGGGLFMPEAMLRSWHSREGKDPGPVIRDIGRSPVAPAAQFESWLTDRALEWLDENAGSPFVLAWSVSPPHADWVAPDPFYSMFDPAAMPLPPSFESPPKEHLGSDAVRLGKLAGEAGMREQLRCYYAQVAMVDAQIGRILARIHDLGLDRDTLVVFTSDHGDMQAAHGMMGKLVTAFYDEIVRVPLLVRYPARIPPGQVLDMQADSVDLMPTILDYLGVPIPGTVQGRSLRPVLDGQTAPDDRPDFCERGLAGAETGRMIRTRDWKYCVYGDGRRELFHLAADPGEMRNLAASPGQEGRCRTMDALLRDWMHRTGDRAGESLRMADQK